MIRLLILLCFIHSLTSSARVYVEGDFLHPAINLLGSTNETKLDFRAGYLFPKWDVSLRYYHASNLGYSGGTFGASNSGVSVSNATDNFVSLRGGYRVQEFTFGAGLGSYSRAFRGSLFSDQDNRYDKNVLGGELFASYKFEYGSFYLRPEVNYMIANVPKAASKKDNVSSYDVSFDAPGMTLLLMAGWAF